MRLHIWMALLHYGGAAVRGQMNFHGSVADCGQSDQSVFRKRIRGVVVRGMAVNQPPVTKVSRIRYRNITRENHVEDYEREE